VMIPDLAEQKRQPGLVSLWYAQGLGLLQVGAGGLPIHARLTRRRILRKPDMRRAQQQMGLRRLTGSALEQCEYSLRVAHGLAQLGQRLVERLSQGRQGAV